MVRFVRFLTFTTLALALLVAPLFGGDDNNLTYLALGDSIAFGFNPLLLPPYKAVPPFPTPNEFIGYPETVEQFERLLHSEQEINASCPGETSGSFLNVAAPDNGCHGSQGFKTLVGLHTTYNGSQAAFAVAQLATNKGINLVTLDIGGNDLLLLEQRCANPNSALFAACVEADLPGVLGSYGANLTTILEDIRTHYQGTLIVVKSYAPSADPLFIAAIEALNTVMVQVGANFGVKFADAFTAFQIASFPFGGDPCRAGLLIRLSPPLTSPLSCDVHPSPLGRDILAATVLAANGYR
jgi:lysophospholipase L1-like esterase